MEPRTRAARAAHRCGAGHPHLLRAPWTKPELLDELRARARRGDFGADLRTAARRLFGSIENARQLAGVAGPARVWTRERVIAALRELVRSGGQTLSDRLSSACKEYFGSVRAACSAARVRWPLRPLIETWSKPKLLEEVRRRMAAGRPLKSLAAVCQNKFGSLQAAILAAGVPDHPQTIAASRAVQQAELDDQFPWRRWSRDAIKRKLRAWSQQGGPMPSDLELACEHRFGSRERACAAADVEPR